MKLSLGLHFTCLQLVFIFWIQSASCLPCWPSCQIIRPHAPSSLEGFLEEYLCSTKGICTAVCFISVDCVLKTWSVCAGICFALLNVFAQTCMRYSPFYSKDKMLFFSNPFSFLTVLLLLSCAKNMITYLSSAQHDILALILNVILLECVNTYIFHCLIHHYNFFYSVKFRCNLGWKNTF